MTKRHLIKTSLLAGVAFIAPSVANKNATLYVDKNGIRAPWLVPDDMCRQRFRDCFLQHGCNTLRVTLSPEYHKQHSAGKTALCAPLNVISNYYL
jgi:hypothetical protein